MLLIMATSSTLAGTSTSTSSLWLNVDFLGMGLEPLLLELCLYCDINGEDDLLSLRCCVREPAAESTGEF